MHADLLHPSRFLKSAEFKGKDVTHVIADVVLEELDREDNSKETKGIVAFSDTPKLLVLNRTNSDCLKAMFGVETDEWRGKRVTFFPFPMVDPFTKKNITAIRLRGSPDIAAPVSVTIRLRKRKPTTMTMQRTGSVPAPLAGADYDAELAAIDAAIEGGTTPEECDAIWSAGVGKRINALSPQDKKAKTDKFKAHKSKVRAPVEAPPA